MVDLDKKGGTARTDITRRRIEKSPVISEGNFIEIGMGVIGIECGKPAIFRLHPTNPIGRPAHRFPIAFLLGLMHCPGNNGSVIEVWIVRIVELKGPAAAL